MKKTKYSILALFLCFVMLLTSCGGGKSQNAQNTPTQPNQSVSQSANNTAVTCQNGHKVVTDEAVTPTCTEPGLTKGSHCLVCNEVIVKQEIIKPNGHSMVADDKVDATCTQSGLTSGAHCVVCNEIMIAQKEIPQLEHNYTDWMVRNESTCTSFGLEYRSCSTCKKEETREIALNPHATMIWVTEKAATCTENGTKAKKCSACLTTFETQTISSSGHSWQDATCTAPKTCSSCKITQGSVLEHIDINADHICDECGSSIINHLDSTNDGDHECDYGCGATLTSCADSDKDHDCDECGVTITSHNYENGYCTVCEGKAPQYTRNGNKITFGSYPQTEVTVSNLTSTLTSKAGTLPTSSNPQAWTSYGYYIEANVENFMWYIDVEHGGEKYRGVYFTSYRPGQTITTSNMYTTYQDDNGYITNTVYWFKYEPIRWTILSEDTANGTALILCDKIIDSQEYDHDGTSSDFCAYSNDYAYSAIRKWLNDTFYNTAFNEFQKQMILTTTVDNSVESTGYSENEYACKNTQDKIFLLSSQDVTNANYGFSSYSSTYNTARQKKTTDYAQVQGASTNTSSSYVGNGHWWLRSPINDDYDSAREVRHNGNADSDYPVYYTWIGVVPALQIML